MQQQPDVAQIQHYMLAMLPIFGFFVIVAWALIIVPFWQIFKKSGMGGPLSLLMVLPLVNIVMLYILAFSRWKVVPAPEYAMGYPPAYPPPGYVPPTPGYVPPTTGYAPPAPGYVPAAPAHPAPPAYPQQAVTPTFEPPPDPSSKF